MTSRIFIILSNLYVHLTLRIWNRNRTILPFSSCYETSRFALIAWRRLPSRIHFRLSMSFLRLKRLHRRSFEDRFALQEHRDGEEGDRNNENVSVGNRVLYQMMWFPKPTFTLYYKTMKTLNALHTRRLSLFRFSLSTLLLSSQKQMTPCIHTFSRIHTFPH